MKLTRRFLAMLLAFSMCLSMVTPAFASEVETVAETEAEAVVEEIAAVEAEAADEAVEDAADEPEASEEAFETVYSVEEAYAEEDEEPSSEATEETEPAGSSEANPLWPEWAWNAAQTEASATVTVPAGATYYVAVMFGGMEMTVNGGEPFMVNGSRFMPEIHTIINGGAEDASYTLFVSVPKGTMSNPEALSELGWIDLSLAEGDMDGYYYTYIAEGTGTATFYFSSVTEGVDADIVLYNENTYIQKTLLEDGVDNYGLEVSIDVNAGDLLNIQVVVVPDMNWNIPAAEITWVGSFAYAAGTEQNPIYPEFVWNEAYTEATATVTVPVGTTYYGVYGGAGMYMSVNGAEPFVLTASNPRMPAVFPITNQGQAEAEYTLVMTYAEGTMENPEVMYWLGANYTSLEANDGDGYFYTYTVENDGVLEFSIVSVTEGVDADIAVSNENTYAQRSVMYDGVDGVASIDVTAGDVLTIQVVALPDASWTIPAADIEWTINYPIGTELNPLYPEFVMNDEWTEGDAVITVPANTTYYCATYSAGMVLTINGGEEQLLKAEGFGRVPAYFTVTNDTDEAAEFALHIAYPAGHQMNPEELYWLGTSYVALEEGDNDGYYYTYTVENDGTLEFSIASVTEGVEVDVSVFNESTYAQRSVMYDGIDGVASIAVTAGDVLTIQVVAMPDASWSIPAADVEWTINYPIGSQLNPLYPEFVMNDEWTEGDAVITVPANTTYYCATYSAGMVLTINGGSEQLLKAEGFGRVPAYFTVTNDTDEAAEFALHIAYPAGHQMNPEELYWLGTSYTTLEEGDNDGYYYTYTAEADGTMEFSIASVTEGVEVDVSVFNENTYAQRSVMYDAVDGVASIAVTAGDVLVIQVVAMPDASWNIPAAEVEWSINYTAGHELNPIYPEFIWNEDNTADATVTVPANATYHYAVYANGMLLFVNGTETTKLVAQGMGRVPAYFSVTNDTDADAEYALHLEYPVGNSANPAELSVFVEGESWDEAEGQNIATVEEGDWYGYNYTWIAPADGELTITMSNGKAGWFYVINNMTAYVYGDNHFSCNGDAISETIAVKTGDEIALVINSCGASAYDITPAGDIYFNAYFVETVGVESNPYQPEWNWNDAWTEGTATVIVPAGVDVYYVGITSTGMLMTINGGEAVEVNGSWYVPQVFELTNGTDEDVAYELHLFFAEGTYNNPADIAEGTTVAELAEGSEGAYYSFIAPDNGEVTISINEGETGWQYFVNNVTNWIYGDSHWSDEEPVVSSETLTVNKGDEIQIFVTTYDPNSWTAPEGSVSFTVDFAGAEGTESNPFIVGTQEPYYYFIPYGETYYYSVQGVSGMQMHINGQEGAVLEMNGETYVFGADNHLVVQMPAAAMGMPAWMQTPVIFSIYNNVERYSAIGDNLWFEYPVGTPNNPQQMVLGKKNTANVEADDMDGYLFTWTATGNGVLEVAMNTGKNWTYSVTNLTAGIYGDIHLSDDAPVVKKEYIAVSKGDEIQIMVNTFDPASWNTPAGKIEFTPKLIVSYTNTLLAGKNTTLKYLDAAGKTVSASKIEWTMAYADGSEVPADVATLKAGKLTAAKTITAPATVIVTGTYEGVAQQFIVTIYPAAVSVTIYDAAGADVSGKTLTLITNKHETWPVLSAVVSPDGALNEVTWKSSNTKVADIDENGNVYPVGNKGNVTFTATAADGSGKKATVKINVTTEVTSIDITSKTGFDTVGAGKALTLIATTNKDAVNQKVDWSISTGAEYATVKAGKLTANKGLTEMHEVTVVATAMDGSGVTGTYTATVLPIANSVAIIDAPATVDLGGWPYAYLGAEVRDAEGNVISGDVTWKSSSDKIATVDAYGTVEFLKAGNVTITATANDGSGKKTSVKITAVKSPWMIELPTEAVVAAGKNLTLTANVLDADATNKKLDWTISENDIGAKVSNGKVSSNAKLVTEPTTVTVTATAQLGDGYGWFATASCDVTIYPATTKVSILSYQNSAAGEEVGKTVNLKSGEQIIVEAVTTPANAAGVYTWKSSDEKIATVEQNPDGTVTVKAHALKNGKATITATAADGTGKKASFTVNVTVNAVALEMDRQYVVAGKSVDLSKQIRFLDYDGCSITPANKTIVWSLWVQDETGNWAPAENNKCAAGTLNAKNGKFTAGKLTEWDCVVINAEYVNAEGVTIGFAEGVSVEIHPTTATIPTT